MLKSAHLERPRMIGTTGYVPLRAGHRLFEEGSIGQTMFSAFVTFFRNPSALTMHWFEVL
jgi:hypothetical protein